MGNARCRPGRPTSTTAWLAGALVGLALLCLPVAAQAATYAVRAENANPGTGTWNYADAPTGSKADQQAGIVTSIEGYTSETSAAPGETVNFHVGTAAGVRYRIEIFRLGWYGGTGARRIACVPSCTGDSAGVVQPLPAAPDAATGIVRAGWPVTDSVTVGSTWVSGYYIAQLVVTNGANAGRARTVPFVIRAASTKRTDIVVQVPVNTWQAYNAWGGKSLYENASVGAPTATGSVAANHVSFDRPYWSYSWNIFDHEYAFVRFLERNGYDVSYVTDVDVDRRPGELLGRRMVVENGHGEYWTTTNRAAYDAARDAGVSIATIGANTGYWHVRYDDAERTVVSYKLYADPDPDSSGATTKFRTIGRPECELFGAQYLAENWATDGVIRSYGVVTASLGDPWFSGSGFAAGDTVTDSVGYEWDSVIPGCATPGPVRGLFHWQGSTPTGASTADAVRYKAPSGARMFSAGSMHFGRSLDSWHGGSNDPRLARFTQNIFADMSGETPAVPAAVPSSGNLLRNPSFESALSPWSSWQGTAARLAAADAADGAYVATVTQDAGVGSFTLDDGATSVTPTTAGRTYTATGWIRAATAAAVGKAATLKLREKGSTGTVLADVTGSPVTLSTTWKQVTVTSTTTASGGTLGVRFSVAGGTGVAFSVDDVRLTTPPANAAPSASFVRAESLPLAGHSVTFTDTSVDGDGVVASRSWDLDGDGVFGDASGVTASRVFASAGSYTVGLRVTDDAGAVDTVSMVVTVTAGNVPPVASFTRDVASPVVGDAVTFTDTSVDGDGVVASRSWDLDGDGVFGDASGVTASRVFASAGSYTVGLRVTDDAGAVDTVSMVVTVTAGNVPPVASFTRDVASPVVGDAVTFTDTSVDGDGVVASRSWDLDGDGVFGDASGVTASRVFASAGSYTVGLRVTDDAGAVDTVSMVVTVTAGVANLLTNPSFEGGVLKPWSSWQGTATAVTLAGAPDGSYVARVDQATSASGASYTLDDGGKTVSLTTGGRVYTATAWVRAATATAVGKPATIRLREKTATGTVVQDVASPAVPLTNAWQRVRLSLAAVATGNVMGARVSQGNAVAGDAYYADLLALTAG